MKSSFWRFFGRFVLLCFMALCGIPGFADNITTSPANCNSATLNTATGPATLNADWEANNINITWFNDGTQITNDANAATQCTYDQTFSLPTPPTKTGYNFAGWRVMNVPNGYTRLEYIQSSGTQYIDTGLKITQNDQVEVKWMYHTESTLSTSGRIFGARYTSGTQKDACCVGTNNGKVDTATTCFAQFGNTSHQGPAVTVGNWLEIKVSKDGYFVNGVAYSSSVSSSSFETPFTLKLFAFGQASGAGVAESIGAGVGRCANFKIYRNNILIQYLIPARDPNNVVGMYDTVSGQFFTNAGSGNFEAGPAVQ